MQHKKIALTFSVSVVAASLIFWPWLEYSAHLANHQISSIFLREKISVESIAAQTDIQTKAKLQKIQEIKEFGKHLYDLKESHSFDNYVALPRKVLGWNLTVAYPLELKAMEFTFPLVGKFGYLGFFNERLKDQWKAKFQKAGFDVYENEIGAYSTLGYFQDPIFSTYLEFDDNQLVRLILHEMAHEKIYFKTDSDFSESLAVYIEKAAANLYFYKSIRAPETVIVKHKVILREYKLFLDTLERYRKELEFLYSGKLPDTEKLQKKKQILDELRKELGHPQYSYLEYAKKVSQMTDLNNAFLVQNMRYTTQQKNGFSSLLINECKEDILCWFAGLEKLKQCDNETRKKFSSTEITLDDALKECK